MQEKKYSLLSSFCCQTTLNLHILPRFTLFVKLALTRSKSIFAEAYFLQECHFLHSFCSQWWDGSFSIDLFRTSELCHHLDIVWIFSLWGREFRKPATLYKTVIAKKRRSTLTVLNMLIECVKTDKIKVKDKECIYSNSTQSVAANAIRKNTNFILKALNVTWKVIITWPFC